MCRVLRFCTAETKIPPFPPLMREVGQPGATVKADTRCGQWSLRPVSNTGLESQLVRFLPQSPLCDSDFMSTAVMLILHNSPRVGLRSKTSLNTYSVKNAGLFSGGKALNTSLLGNRWSARERNGRAMARSRHGIPPANTYSNQPTGTMHS